MALLNLSLARLAALSVAVGSTSLLGAQTAAAEKYAALVMNAETNEILHSRNADDARYPASLTKVMTLYLLFDAINAGEVSLSDKMLVSRNAAAQPPSNLKLKAGSRIRVEDAILALVTKSANDVAVVVAEHLGGTEKKFAVQMTGKARDLGLNNTTFKNASGLPNTAQVTTAYDLALLADALLEQHGQYYHYFQNDKFSWGRMVYNNHNDLIGDVDGVDGIKTGYTRASGFNLMTSAERDGQRVIVVMLGGATAKSRNAHVEDLVEAAFAALGGPADPTSPQLRGTTVFASVQTPVNPNGAAEPMLNGQPFSSYKAEPVNLALGETTEDAVTEDMIIVEGDAADEPASVQPSPALPAPGASFSVSDYEARQTADAARAAGAAVSEYEARQKERAANAGRVAEYTLRQTRR
jgi:D-alanyl-D-alanine carboxypeptidase